MQGNLGGGASGARRREGSVMGLLSLGVGLLSQPRAASLRWDHISRAARPLGGWLSAE